MVQEAPATRGRSGVVAGPLPGLDDLDVSVATDDEKREAVELMPLGARA